MCTIAKRFQSEGALHCALSAERERLKCVLRREEMAEELVTLNPGERIKDYQVSKKLGEGGFGAVYQVTDARTGQMYAMKVEGAREAIQVLKMEVVVLRDLAARGKKHVCRIQDRGRNDQFNYVIMTLVGQSLSDLKKACPNQRFSLGSALRVGFQCLEALADLHAIGYLHRDIKPGNFAIGREEMGEHRNVVILDFGLARKYINDRGEIRTPRAAAGFRGTVRYAPLNCHRSQELSRKDDLETWFYQQVELTVGRLPWADTQDKEEVARRKVATRSNDLYANCPRTYKDMLTYIDSLKYWDQPDYNHISQCLRLAMQQAGVREQDPYDWETGGQHHHLTSRLPPPQFNPHREAGWVNF